VVALMIKLDKQKSQVCESWSEYCFIYCCPTKIFFSIQLAQQQ